MFVNSIYIWYNKNMDKNMFNINNNELSYGIYCRTARFIKIQLS